MTAGKAAGATTYNLRRRSEYSHLLDCGEHVMQFAAILYFEVVKPGLFSVRVVPSQEV